MTGRVAQPFVIDDTGINVGAPLCAFCAKGG